MKTALVIDDEAPLRELLGRVLESAGWRVLQAGEATEGLRLACQEKPQVILLDFLLPGMGGVQLLQTLQQAAVTASIPVIMMSGMGADEPLFQALAYDAAGYLMKPFSSAQLLQSVQQALGRKTEQPPVVYQYAGVVLKSSRQEALSARKH